MKAVVYSKYGGPEVLKLEDIPEPVPGQGEVLVKIHAAALNPVDLVLQKGKFRFLGGQAFPKVPGSDFAGEIVAVGGNVKKWKIRDRVYGMTRVQIGGAYSEYIKISSGEIGRIPGSLSYIEAAGFPLAAQTTLQALRNHGRIKPGQKVLINGASGGVGVFGTQIAKAIGARITAICSYRNIKMVESLGADEVIDYTTTDILALPEKYDIFYDVYGNKSYHKVKHLLTPSGRYISTIPRLSNFVDQFTTALSSRRARVVMVKSRTADLDLLNVWISSGQLKPVVDKVYPLKDAGLAQQYLATRRAKGKVILEV